MSDLSKIILTSDNATYKNNDIYVGSFVISGTTSPGVNTKTTSITLPEKVDLTDILFTGRACSDPASDPRPNGAWFDSGDVWVIGNDVPSGYTDEETNWRLYSKITGGQLVITAIYTQTFIANLALTSATVQYRLVDYSAFL